MHDGKHKQILHKLTGYAKPGQILSIMGASGSGKTSLLNVLGQRIWLSSSSKLIGNIKCNNKIMKKNDFSKFGAFVQQDDILLETFSPEESLNFAAKLMTNLN